MIRLNLQLLCLMACLALSPMPAQAQASAPATAPPSRSSLPTPALRATAPLEPEGLLQQAYGWLTAWQARINRQLASAVRDIHTGNPLMATLVLAAMSFAYGVLHAAGPGHGKAVISSYVLANERTMRRGIALSFLAALIQGLSALVIVTVLVVILKATGLTVRSTEAWLETVSWGLVAFVGAWLLWREVHRLRQAPMAAHARYIHHARDHSQQGPHNHGHHDHAHAHDGACCDHAHMPDPKQLEGEWSWRKALPIALAVGVRPCTGAILVLVFAIGQGLFWAGVLATFTMALGTAITVSALAAATVGSRELAARLGNRSVGSDRVRIAAGIGGSALVILLGVLFFLGSLNGGTGL